MFPNVSLTEGLGVAGIIAPVTTANTQKNTGAIDLSKWDSLLFVFQLGDMAAERSTSASRPATAMAPATRSTSPASRPPSSPPMRPTTTASRS